MQETRVKSLIREDPICCGATKIVCHNYWSCALEPGSHNYWAHMPLVLKPMCLRSQDPQEKPLQWEALTPQLQSSPHSSKRKAHTAMKNQHRQKLIKNFLKNMQLNPLGYHLCLIFLSIKSFIQTPRSYRWILHQGFLKCSLLTSCISMAWELVVKSLSCVSDSLQPYGL